MLEKLEQVIGYSIVSMKWIMWVCALGTYQNDAWHSKSEPNIGLYIISVSVLNHLFSGNGKITKMKSHLNNGVSPLTIFT